MVYVTPGQMMVVALPAASVRVKVIGLQQQHKQANRQRNLRQGSAFRGWTPAILNLALAYSSS
jgi:hypothetical protein